MKKELKEQTALILLIVLAVPAVFNGVDPLSAALGGLVFWSVLRPGEVYRAGHGLYRNAADVVNRLIKKLKV